MPRKITFDYDQAVDKAMALFWQRGYAETGLRDLLKAMDIGEGSFYNTLKSKKDLYIVCLQRYEDRVIAPRMQALAEAPTAASGIRAFFAAVLDSLDDPATPSRLCMLAAMEAQEVLAEPDLHGRAEHSLAELHALLVRRLTEDQNKGLAPATLDVPAAASLVVTYLQGLWRTAMVSYDRTHIERQLDVLVPGLGL